MRKILMITILALVAMVGTAAASLTHDASIWNENGTGVAPNPLYIKPGDTLVLSYHASQLTPEAIGKNATYGSRVAILDGFGDASHLKVHFTHKEFAPTTIPNFTDIGVIELQLDENAQVGTRYKVTIQVGDNDTVNFIYGQASRQTEAIPEFPTVALPVAAILGLAFFMQRRREE